MMPYLERGSRWGWLLFPPSLAALPLLLWITTATGHPVWLALAFAPVVLGLAWSGPATAFFLYGYTGVIYLFIGLRLQDAEAWLRIACYFFMATAMLGLALLFRRREQLREQAHQEYALSLEERLSLAREQYKTDLIVHVSNQRKIQKYFLLNRVSRLFGSQLDLARLAEVVVREVRDIIGAERGRYMLALLPNGGQPLVHTLPDGIEPEAVQDDQFALWVTQHRTALLVSDTQKDFRFHTDLSGVSPRSLMVAPLLCDGRVVGILRAESAYAGIFSTDDLRLFSILADLAAVAAENARLYQRTQELSITDGLTGLYLRRFFNQRLDEEITRYREHRTPFALLIVDLDHFKNINDRLGHLTGDQVLVHLAETLRAEARNTDILCRFGGEEFALLLPHTPCRAGLVMAERIRQHVGQKKYASLPPGMNLTVSIGVAGCPEHAESAPGLVKNADEALYAAKRAGRDRVVLAGGGG